MKIFRYNYKTIRSLLSRRIYGRNFCFLSISPISKYVVNAALNVASQFKAPLIFVASLNQIDVDGGYTGWTPMGFAEYVKEYVRSAELDEVVVILQLDHGGPWLKDEHIIRGYSYEDAVDNFLNSLKEFIKAGFNLIHIDTTVDLDRASHTADLEVAILRTVKLIEYAEEMSREYGAEIGYEVGSDRWGYKSPEAIDKFTEYVVSRLKSNGFNIEKIVFGVADVGTEVRPDNKVNPLTIQIFSDIMQRHSMYLKIHSGDYLDFIETLLQNNVGGLNVGPMFAHTMYSTVKKLILGNLKDELASELITELNMLIMSADRLKKYTTGKLSVIEEYKLGLASRYIWTSNRAEALLDKISRYIEFDLRAALVKQLEEEISKYFIRLGLFHII